MGVVTGQLAVPLHHVEGVGDIAVLPPVACPGAHDETDCTLCARSADWPCDGTGNLAPAAPVVGQVVAHVEKCATCHDDEGNDIGSYFVCPVSGDYSWVRDQYVRVTAVLPIVDWDGGCAEKGDHIVVTNSTEVWRMDGFGSGHVAAVLDLPGAAPGGTALVVELAECPECNGLERSLPCRCLGLPMPVPAPSAPYTEDQ